ncbi:MAG: winged helix-turn-helix domain-containing protein [Thermoanaerobaculia bacterium]
MEPEVLSAIPECWRLGKALILDAAERRLTRAGEEVPLPPRALDLLVRLARAEGHLVTREVLLTEVWAGAFVEEGTLSRHVSTVRRALGEEAVHLETVPKAGYRLRGVVAIASSSARPDSPAGPAEASGAGLISRPRRLAALWLTAAAILLLALLAILRLRGGVPPARPGDPAPPSTATDSRARQLEAARELAVRAAALTARRSEAEMLEAVRLYRQAVELDPESASLQAALAASIALVSGTSLPAASYDSARLHAKRALELDPATPDAHAVLGLIAMNRAHDWVGAETEYRRALELDPDSVQAHHWLGEMLVLLGRRTGEGLELLRRAHRLAPGSQAIASDLAKAHYFARQYGEAVAAATSAIDLDPSFAHAYRWRGFARAELGACAEAERDMRSAVGLDPTPIVRAELANVLGRCERLGAAREIAAALESEARSGYVSPLALLVARAGVGEVDAALDALEGLESSGDMTLGAATAPCFDHLRSSPRFAAHLSRVGNGTRTEQ